MNGLYRLTGLKAGDRYHIEIKPPFLAADPTWHHQSPCLQNLPEDAKGEVELPDVKLLRFPEGYRLMLKGVRTLAKDEWFTFDIRKHRCKSLRPLPVEGRLAAIQPLLAMSVLEADGALSNSEFFDGNHVQFCP